MNTSNFVIEVSEVDFEYEVINYSQNTPVVVDFWAEWCGPCKTLGPILTRLAQEGQGSFRLAKVNVDENQNLAMRYGVRSIPTVKAFIGGRVFAEFIGLQPEPRVREFLSKLVSSEAGLSLEKARGLLNQHQWAAAEEQCREVLAASPGQPAALLGLAQSLLVQGRGGEASAILRSFPASKEYAAAETLLPLADAVTAYERGELDSDTTLEAAFRNAVRLASRGSIYPALDGLLDILREDKRFRSGTARTVFLGLLEILGEEDPQTRQYRVDLSNVLF